MGVSRNQIDGKLIRAVEEPTYLLLNKPLGVVTTLNDPEGRRVVTDLLWDQPVRLFPVGRLDINTSGILLIIRIGYFDLGFEREERWSVKAL